MKLNNIKNIALAGAVALLGGLGMTSCTDGNDWDVDGTYERLFGLYGEKLSVAAEDVTATVTFTTVPDVEYFIVEVSTDSLYDGLEQGGANSIVYGEDKSLTGSPITLTGLAGDTKYFLRIKAMSDSMKESHWAYYRSDKKTIKTFKTKAEQIFNESVASDRKESSLRVSWDASKSVTNLVVTDAEGNEVQNITLDDAAKAAGEYTVTGLTPSTNYTLTIMNGTAKRGTLTMSTSAAMPDGDYKTELSADISRINNDLINEIVAEAKAATGKENVAVTIGLQPDKTYDVYSTAEDGTDANLKLPDGVSVTFFGLAGGNTPVMNWKKCLDIAGSHSYIRFENVDMTDGGCQYFINQGTAASVGEISFKECAFTDFERSVIRTQGSGAISIDNIIVDDCVLTNMSSANGYSVFYFGTASTKVGKLELKNSTFDKTGRSFIEASKAAISGGVNITNCTFYNNVQGGRYFMDANGQATNLTLTNTILGKSQDATSRGVRTAGTVTVENSLRTSDCVYASNDFKEFAADASSSADVFNAPDSHDFTLKINSRIGDPRWFPTE